MFAFIVFNSVVFMTFLFLNFFLISAGSSAAVPVGTIFALIALWFLVSVPLCFLGAYAGFKRPRIEQPVRTNQIPRQIGEQPFFLRFWPSILMGGVLPFGAIFIELYAIMGRYDVLAVFTVFL
jgi:transmembrane 9 superfamily protein 2/4